MKQSDCSLEGEWYGDRRNERASDECPPYAGDFIKGQDIFFVYRNIEVLYAAENIMLFICVFIPEREKGDVQKCNGCFLASAGIRCIRTTVFFMLLHSFRRETSFLTDAHRGQAFSPAAAVSGGGVSEGRVRKSCLRSACRFLCVRLAALKKASGV